MDKSFYYEHLFLLKQIINSHQYKYIYNLHLIVRPTFKSKNEMGSHVTRGQVAATGNGIVLPRGRWVGTQS